MRSAPRCWRAAATGRDVVQKFIDGQNRIRWMKAGRRVLRLPPCRRAEGQSRASREDLVRKARVGVAPGSAFGLGRSTRDDAYVRICFAQDAGKATGRRRWTRRDRAIRKL